MTISSLPKVQSPSFSLTSRAARRLWQPSISVRADEGRLVRHHGLLQQAIESTAVTFPDCRDALLRRLPHRHRTLSRGRSRRSATLTAEQWASDRGPVRVRMALHSGTVDLHAGEHKSGEYVSGLTLSHTARLLSVAYGGQILVSNATQELVRNDLPSRVGLRNLGRHRLRDLAHAEHIYQVVAPDLPDAFPALKSVEAVPNNLPRQLTTFIGRERVIGELKRLLAETHLLTVMGAGGSGKTRLSLEVAASLLDEFPDGVWLVEFFPGMSAECSSPLADPALCPQVPRPRRSAFARRRAGRYSKRLSTICIPSGCCSSSTTASILLTRAPVSPMRSCADARR